MTRSISRREMLVGTGFALVSARAGSVATHSSVSSSIPPAPVARIQVVTDTYFGETVQDPYRWMENDKDPDWLPYLKGQNDHTRAVLNRIPGRDALLKRIQQLSGETAATRSEQR